MLTLEATVATLIKTGLFLSSFFFLLNFQAVPQFLDMTLTVYWQKVLDICPYDIWRGLYIYVRLAVFVVS